MLVHDFSFLSCLFWTFLEIVYFWINKHWDIIHQLADTCSVFRQYITYMGSLRRRSNMVPLISVSEPHSSTCYSLIQVLPLHYNATGHSTRSNHSTIWIKTTNLSPFLMDWILMSFSHMVADDPPWLDTPLLPVTPSALTFHYPQGEIWHMPQQ